MVAMAMIEDIGQTFRAIRRHYKETLKNVSDATGLSVSFLSDMERGQTNPSLRTMVVLADHYDLEIRIGLLPTRCYQCDHCGAILDNDCTMCPHCEDGEALK
jgi:transcriptional regulator with XRE-family HTH domain